MNQIESSMHPARQEGLAVTQANALALSAYEMTLLEKRLLVMGIAKIDVKKVEKLHVRVYVNEYNHTFGGTTHSNYQRLKDGAKQLLQRVVYVEQGGGEWEMYQWVTFAHYMPGSKSEDGAYIDMTFNDKLGPFLLDLKENFNTYALDKIAHLQSVYSVRLYEMLLHTSFGGRIPRLEFDLDDLKFRLRVKFSEKNKVIDRYLNFKDFRTRVLEQARRECDENTDLSFTFATRRQGRRISKVIFLVKTKREVAEGGPIEPLGARPGRSLSPDIQELAILLREVNYVGNIEEIVNEYGVEYVRRTVEIARKVERDAASSSKPIRNLGGLIQHLLKSGVAREDSKRLDGGRAPTVGEIDRLARMCVDALSHARTEHAEHVWEFMTEEERDRVHDLMRIELSKFEVKQLNKASWQGPTYTTCRNKILFSHHAELYPKSHATVAAFVAEEGLLGEFGEKVQHEIISVAEELM